MRYDIDLRREVRFERKRQRIIERSGSENPCCASCGIDWSGPNICFLYWSYRLREVVCGNCSRKRRTIKESSIRAKVRKFAKRGYPNPKCVVCGENDMRCLELNHVFAEANSDLCGPKCTNCHAIFSDMQEDHGGEDIRLRDRERGGLLLQTAILIGMVILLVLLGTHEQKSGNESLGTMYISIGETLTACITFDFALHEHLSDKYGPDYDQGLTLELPS